jgi:PAS domain S-box-containing protein
MAKGECMSDQNTTREMLKDSKHGDRTGTISAGKAEVQVANDGVPVLDSEAFRRIFKDHGAVIYIVDLSTFTIIDANRAALDFYGYDLETMRTKRIPDLNTMPEEEIRAEIKRAVEEGRSLYACKHRLASGEIRDVEVYANPISIQSQEYSFSVVHDITARRLAEEELARAANEWQATFDATNDSIWILSKEQRIIGCNKASELLFQCSHEEIIGKYCWEIVHGTEQPIPECPILRMMESLSREFMELQIGKRWFQIVVDPLLDATGKYNGAVHIISDITKRKQIENELLESERKYRDLFQKGSDLLCIHDLEGNLLETNLAYKKRYGLSSKDLRGVNIRTLVPDRYKSEFDQYLERIIQNADDEGYARIVNKFGDVVILEYRNKLIRDSIGKPLSVQGSARDVTSRIKAEKALRESEERISIATQVGNLGVWELRFDIDKLFASEKLIEITGLTEEEVRNFSLDLWMSKIHPDDKKRTQDIQQALFKGEIEKAESELRLRHPEKGWVWLHGVARIIQRDEEGKPLRMIGVHHDITSRKQSEAEREKLIKELEKALSEVKALSGLLPICSSCKKIRDDMGYWNQIESYIHKHSEAQFSHSICPECAKKLYPDIDLYKD